MAATAESRSAYRRSRRGSTRSYVDAILAIPPVLYASAERGWKSSPPNAPATRSPDLAKLLQTWIDRGRSPDAFYLPAETGTGSSPYQLSEDLGESLTNIGDCVPVADGVATQKTKMTAMDNFFASLEKSPPGQGTMAEHRPARAPDQTDLFHARRRYPRAPWRDCLRPALPLVGRQCAQDSSPAGAARTNRFASTKRPTVRHSAQHPLLQDVP